MSNPKSTTKILVDLESKRDYLLSAENVKEVGVKMVVNTTDAILNDLELIYDDIINNKGIDFKTLQKRYRTIQDRLEKTKGKLYGAGLQ